MKKSPILLPLFFIILIQFPVFFSHPVNAGEAGVGVLNVPPKYGYIRVEQQDDLIRVYITISDYNSWGDIDTVNVTLDNYGAEIHKFKFQQYKNKESYVEVNEFSEMPEGTHLLQKEKCLYERSSDSETIDERCDMNIRFVFLKTWFTAIKISIQDKQGSAPAEAYINYNSEDTMRSGNTIVFPFFEKSIIITIPPYLIDLIAITTAFTGTVYFIKKRLIKRIAVYEKIS
jgi:hypothetical protein